MSKKKTTTAAAKPRTRKKKSDAAPETASAVETPEVVEKSNAEAPRAALKKRPARRPTKKRVALDGDDGEHEVTIAVDPHDDEPPGAEVSDFGVSKRAAHTAIPDVIQPLAPGAQVERANNAVVIRFPSARSGGPAAPAAPAQKPATPVAPPQRPERRDAPSESARPATASPAAGDAGRTAPPRPGDPNENAAGELGEGGGRRRRRRRRGGRGRGDRDRQENGQPPSGEQQAQRGNERRPDRSDRGSRPNQPQRQDRPAEGAGPADADPFRGLSPSQKRRLRRRRKQQQRPERDSAVDAPVASPNAAIEDMKAEIARERAEEDRRTSAADAARPPLEPQVFDPDADEELLEARDVLEHVDNDREEPAAPDADDAADTAEPDEPQTAGQERRGRRDRNRDRRGRPNFRRRRDYGEPDIADSRVWGEESESAAIEISPDEGPGGVESLTEGETDAGAAKAAKRKEMVINIAPNEECRIAILEDGKLEQIYLERASAESHVGNIYKGLVTNVEASIQAAFIDFGLGKNGFLHISDLHPKFFPNGENSTENVGRKLPRKARPPIQRCLRRGQEIIVQITKEGIGTKGPTLTTYLSIPGRFLVMMPGMRQLGVSRKIEDEDLRRKLRAQMNELELPDDIGFIARTAAEERSTKELQSDLNYLTRLWRAVEKRIKSEPAPAELYRDSDLVIRTIRDVFASDVHRVIVDDADVANRAAEFLAIFSPKARDTVLTYAEPEPIFHKYGIEAELERLHSRHVPLRSGGSLVIDQTEALVAIDVNSGRFRQEDDAEQTAYKINCDAADEIPRQLRLRDLGGVIICDFIDMRREEHRREIERRLIKNLKQHKERAKVLRISQFGIIEMTRQRQRASLTRSVYQDCHHCRGSGLVKTSESVALDVMRLIQLAVTREHIRAIEVAVSPEVAFLLQNRKRAVLHEIETRYERSIAIKPENQYSLDYVQINCFDSRGRLVPHP